jgi:hypothetical protein
MRKLLYAMLASILMCAPAMGEMVLFDFEGAQNSQSTLELTVNGVTARFENAYINDIEQSIVLVPAGFFGNGLDCGPFLIVSFPLQMITDFSIMVAPLITGANGPETAVFYVEAYKDGFDVGTNTFSVTGEFFPPTTVHFESAPGFNEVFIINASAPFSGFSFVADNMTVVTAPVPEPSTLVMLSTLALIAVCIGGLRKRLNQTTAAA